MSEQGNQHPEAAMHAAWQRGDFDSVARLALERYGSEIMSFVTWRLRDANDGREAFSIFAEDLWCGLPNFGWRCSLRTWLYTLARNAAHRYVASPHRRAEQRLANPEALLSQVAQTTASATQHYQRSSLKEGVRVLRERLDPEDQLLLVLRIDRGLSWRELAMAMSGDAELADTDIGREATRLRKSFQRLKQDLRRMAQEQGLLAAK